MEVHNRIHNPKIGIYVKEMLYVDEQTVGYSSLKKDIYRRGSWVYLIVKFYLHLLITGWKHILVRSTRRRKRREISSKFHRPFP